VDGAGVPKPVSSFGLLRMAFGLTAASLDLTRVNERQSRVSKSGQLLFSSAAKNNQLRTGADKGNPTV
jgi:hypothetical protein